MLSEKKSTSHRQNGFFFVNWFKFVPLFYIIYTRVFLWKTMGYSLSWKKISLIIFLNIFSLKEKGDALVLTLLPWLTLADMLFICKCFRTFKDANWGERFKHCVGWRVNGHSSWNTKNRSIKVEWIEFRYDLNWERKVISKWRIYFLSILVLSYFIFVTKSKVEKINKVLSKLMKKHWR